MATREENLKKLNEELEKLSDEELEEIAGGGRNLFEEIKPNILNQNQQNAPDCACLGK